MYILFRGRQEFSFSCAVFIVLLSAGIAGRYSNAADWTVNPSLAFIGTYLDNVTLAPPGDEASDFVTEINPGISVSGDGSRFDFRFDYRMQNLFYSNFSDANTTNHELSTDANAELMRDLLFIDFSGSYSQVLIEPTGRVGVDNVSIGEDTTDQGIFSISPYILRRFGNAAHGEFRYTYDRVDYAGESAADSQVNQVFANLSSSSFSRALAGGSPNDSVRQMSSADELFQEPQEPQGQQTQQEDSLRYLRRRLPVKTPSKPLQWSATYSLDQFDGEDGTSSRFEQALLDLTYIVGPNLALLAGLGYEDNDFDSQNEATQQPKGFAWNAGAAWSPIRHTVLEARVGDRFFGNTYSFFLRHFTRRTNATIEYREEFINPAGTALENQDRPIASLIETGPVPACDQNGTISTPSPGVGNEVFFRKRLTVDLCKATAKSAFVIGAYEENRDFQVSGDEEQVYGGSISWDWRLSERTRSLIDMQWGRLIEEGGQQDDWDIGLQVTRQIRPDIEGALEYRYLRRDAPGAEDDYEQNSIAASVRVRF
ncbi:MAG: TIGR03016 family PEP-CTERM system-associated outer membrane protein [Candidatus Competibacteraceae bacterium]